MIPVVYKNNECCVINIYYLQFSSFFSSSNPTTDDDRWIIYTKEAEADHGTWINTDNDVVACHCGQLNTSFFHVVIFCVQFLE